MRSWEVCTATSTSITLTILRRVQGTNDGSEIGSRDFGVAQAAVIFGLSCFIVVSVAALFGARGLATTSDAAAIAAILIVPNVPSCWWLYRKLRSQYAYGVDNLRRGICRVHTTGPINRRPRRGGCRWEWGTVWDRSRHAASDFCGVELVS